MGGDDDELKRISITMLLAGILLASCADDLAEVKNEDEVTENIIENDSEENEENRKRQVMEQLVSQNSLRRTLILANMKELRQSGEKWLQG